MISFLVIAGTTVNLQWTIWCLYEAIHTLRHILSICNSRHWLYIYRLACTVISWRVLNYRSSHIVDMFLYVSGSDFSTVIQLIALDLIFQLRFNWSWWFWSFNCSSTVTHKISVDVTFKYKKLCYEKFRRCKVWLAASFCTLCL